MMKHLVLIAGAAALSVSAPGLAKPGMGHGFGNPHGNPHDLGIGFRGRPAGPVGYGARGCPPGLAKKSVACMPPGQARKLGIGSQVPAGYALLSYGALPRSVRIHHGVSESGRYVYNRGTVYQVNPRTRTVTRIIRSR